MSDRTVQSSVAAITTKSVTITDPGGDVAVVTTTWITDAADLPRGKLFNIAFDLTLGALAAAVMVGSACLVAAVFIARTLR
jgi:hypothetical protein